MMTFIDRKRSLLVNPSRTEGRKYTHSCDDNDLKTVTVSLKPRVKKGEGSEGGVKMVSRERKV